MFPVGSSAMMIGGSFTRALARATRQIGGCNMRGSSFRYLMKTGIRNLWRNRVMAFTSIGVLTTYPVADEFVGGVRHPQAEGHIVINGHFRNQPEVLENRKRKRSG